MTTCASRLNFLTSSADCAIPLARYAIRVPEYHARIIGSPATGPRTTWVTPQETALIERGLPEPPGELQIGKPLPWRTIFDSKDVLAIAFSYFTYGYAAWIFFAWFFKYLSEVRGLALKSSAYYAMLPFIALAAVFIASGTQVESARLASVVLAGGAGALYLSQSSFWSVTADMAGASAGSVAGVMNMGGQIGGIVTASLTPLIAH
jgi:ACS family glucarate transporter-like MFS transporter